MHTCTYTHTHIHTHIHAYTHAHTQSYTQGLRTNAIIESDCSSKLHFPGHTHTHTHIHTHTHTHTYTHTHTHKHRGYEPMPSSKVILDPSYRFPDTYSTGYVPDDWYGITRMDELESFESGYVCVCVFVCVCLCVCMCV